MKMNVLIWFLVYRITLKKKKKKKENKLNSIKLIMILKKKNLYKCRFLYGLNKLDQQLNLHNAKVQELLNYPSWTENRHLLSELYYLVLSTCKVHITMKFSVEEKMF